MAIRRRDGVSFEPSGDTVVILDPDGTEMTTLNPVGAVIWRAFDGNRTAAELAAALITDFDGTTVDELERDIEDFAEELAGNGLVEID